jgi:hypothetical protein
MGKDNSKPFFLRDRLSDAQIEKFKLFEDEELIFACREHWLPLVLRLFRLAFIGLTLAIALSFVFVFIFHSISLGISSFLFLLLVTGMISIRYLIHWSFHLYIATNKQIIEVHYSPLMSEAINSVLLDQIRCTEIDVEMFGIIPELIGIGDVELTFDRPTHKEEFVIKSIRSPRTIANLLSAQIHQTNPQVAQKQYMKQPLWIKDLRVLSKNKYRFLGRDTKYGYNTN